MTSSNDPIDVWSRIDPAVMPQTTVQSGSAGGTESAARTVRQGWPRRKFIVCTAVASMVWLYVFVEVLLFDADQWASASLGPIADVLVKYRFFVVLVMLVPVVWNLKRTWTAVLYVALFPILVPTLLLPWFLFRSKNWNALFATVHVISSVVYRFRFRFVATVLVLVAALLTVASPLGWLTALAAVVLMAALLVDYVRAIRGVFARSRFLRRQTEVIESIVGSSLVQEFVSLDSDLKSESIEKYNSGQLQLLTQRVGYAVTLHRGVYLWASKLQGYGRSGFITMLNVLGYLWLFVESVLAFALVNRALFEINPGAFATQSPPTLLTWVSYAMSSLALNSIQAIEPVGDAAVALRVLAGFLGPVLLVTLISGVLMSFKRERQQEHLDEAVASLRRQGQTLRHRFKGDFGVTPEEALRRLEGLGLTIGLLVLTASLPDDYDSSADGS